MVRAEYGWTTKELDALTLAEFIDAWGAAHYRRKLAIADAATGGRIAQAAESKDFEKAIHRLAN